MAKLVLLRHGQSVWNKENRFTGWKDVALTPKGEGEAKQAGILLRQANIVFAAAFTSSLKRAYNSTMIALPEMGQPELCDNIPQADELRERNYGTILTGMNKDEAIRIYGKDAVHDYRRGYHAELPGEDWENLHDVVKRVWPYYNMNIEPLLKDGKNVLIIAHGNTNRGIIKKVCGETEQSIEKIEPGTAVPVILELDEHNLSVQGRYFITKGKETGAPVFDHF